MAPEVVEGKCVVCGHVLQVGDWPSCPHQSVLEGGGAEYFPDEIPGGMLIENGVPTPTMVYSRSEMDALRAAGQWVRKETFSPMPGTDIDPAGVMNPKGYQDSRTLENGRELMLRAAGTPPDIIDTSKMFIIHDDEILNHKDAVNKLRSLGEDVPEVEE